MCHGPSEPSAWVRRFADRIPASGRVLDLAAGGGRHTRLMVALGHPVTAIDRDLSGIADLLHNPAVLQIGSDIEERGWPLPAGHQFAGVIVTNYLHRPLLPALVAAVASGGCLIYETFAVGNERLGRPTNPDFLLRPGELLEAVRGQLTVVAYEN
ncbi:MAG: class I SAM-dependent methyltransferase, partial [Dongiaceae bacterium]